MIKSRILEFLRSWSDYGFTSDRIADYLQFSTTTTSAYLDWFAYTGVVERIERKTGIVLFKAK